MCQVQEFLFHSMSIFKPHPVYRAAEIHLQSPANGWCAVSPWNADFGFRMQPALLHKLILSTKKKKEILSVCAEGVQSSSSPDSWLLFCFLCFVVKKELYLNPSAVDNKLQEIHRPILLQA